MAPSVRLQGVSKRFGSLTAVRQMDLDIPQGEFFTMLGPSGCGNPRHLSGAKQQGGAPAGALATRPAVLLLDEPLGALDLKLRKQLQVELKRIQQEVGITFVYVTHDQE